jgi:DNA-binding CsgD family transcriptional regulator
MAYFSAKAKPPHRPTPTLMPNVSLTDRESEVLLRVAKGYTLPEIGVQLGLSRHTIADYVKQIYRKLNVSSRAEAALEAQRLGLFLEWNGGSLRLTVTGDNVCRQARPK